MLCQLTIIPLLSVGEIKASPDTDVLKFVLRRKDATPHMSRACMPAPRHVRLGARIARPARLAAPSWRIVCVQPVSGQDTCTLRLSVAGLDSHKVQVGVG